MLRFVAPAVTVVFVLGCNAPAPSLGVFAPGATRIPPPATGSYSTNGSYYEGPHITSPPVGTDSRLRINQSSQAKTPTLAQLASDEEPTTDMSPFKAIGFERRESASGAGGSEPRIRIVDNRQPGSSDGPSSAPGRSTNLAEPKPFRPTQRLIDISQLPAPTRSVSPAVESRRVINSATGQTRSAKSGASKSRTAAGWQARDRTDYSVQIAGR